MKIYKLITNLLSGLEIGKYVYIDDNKYLGQIIDTNYDHFLVLLLNDNNYTDTNTKLYFPSIQQLNGLYLLNSNSNYQILPATNISDIVNKLNQTGGASSSNEQTIDTIRNTVSNIQNSQLKITDHNVTKIATNDLNLFNENIHNLNPDTTRKISEVDIFNTYGLMPDVNTSTPNEFTIVFNTEEPMVLPSEYKEQLQTYVNNISQYLDPKSDIKYVVSKALAVDSHIKSIDDEKYEGQKIIDWLNNIDCYVKSRLTNTNLDDCISRTDDSSSLWKQLLVDNFSKLIFNGYVYIKQQGVKPEDIITEELVPNLDHFDWQYNKPINYSVLKSTILQNDLQQKLKEDQEQLKEAQSILSQEYLFALQPKPEFQMLCVKLLLILWLVDDDFRNNIRKIGILINQWRSKTDETYNKMNGIKPSIIIYTRYGIQSAKIVFNKINAYFGSHSNMGWTESMPSYYTKHTNLIWYTNGISELKLYYRKVVKNYNGAITHSIFNDTFTKLNIASDIQAKY